MLANTEKKQTMHHYWEFADNLFVVHSGVYHGYCEHTKYRSGCDAEPQNSLLNPIIIIISIILHIYIYN